MIRVTILIQYQETYYYLGTRTVSTLPIPNTILVIEGVKGSMQVGAVSTIVQEALFDIEASCYPYIVCVLADKNYVPDDLEKWGSSYGNSL